MWFVTRDGHLVHGDGGLATVYRDRGYSEITNEDAQERIVEERDRAAAEAEASRAGDERTRRQAAVQKRQAAQARSKLLAQAIKVETDTTTTKDLTPGQVNAVDRAIADEAPVVHPRPEEKPEPNSEE